MKTRRLANVLCVVVAVMALVACQAAPSRSDIPSNPTRRATAVRTPTRSSLRTVAPASTSASSTLTDDDAVWGGKLQDGEIQILRLKWDMNESGDKMIAEGEIENTSEQRRCFNAVLLHYWGEGDDGKDYGPASGKPTPQCIQPGQTMTFKIVSDWQYGIRPEILSIGVE